MSDFQDWEEFDPALLDQIAEEDPEYAAQLARQYKRAMTVLAREDPSWFCQYVLRHELTNGLIRQSPAHRLMQAALQEQDRNLIWTFPGCGKCSATGTNVLLADGSWRTVETLREWTKVLTWDGVSPNLKVVTARATPNGRKPCVRVELENGVVLRVTENHPLMTGDLRWVQADQIKAGESVVTIRETAVPEPWNTPETPEAEIPGDEAEILGYLLAGRILGRGVIVRTLDKSEKWSERRKRLFEAAGWEFKKYGKRSLLVLPGTGVMAPADFLLSLAKVQHGWPVDVAGSVWRLPRVAHQRLLCGILSMAFHGAGKDLMGRTVGVAGIRTPVGFLHPHRPTLELFRRLFLRSGAPARISDLVTKVRLPRGGGIWREIGTRPLYLFRLQNEDVGRFWPTKRCRYVEQLPWELTKVVRVTKIPPLETWAVEVQEAEHSYIAEGVLNHNTNQVAIGHVLWRLGKNPNQTIGILCNSGKMAAKILSALKTYVAESIELHDVFPNLKPGEKWAEYSFSVDRDTIRKDPSVQAIGLTGKFVGSRFDGLIMDDVDNVDTTLTQEARDRTEQLVRKQAVSRLDSKSWAVAIGNVWHENDLMHRLEKTGWRPLKFQVMNPATGESNDPENFPLERIHQIRDVDQGPIEFQRLYQLQARQEGEQRCRQEWVDICLKKGNQQVLYRDGLEKIPAGCRTITGVDLGVKKKASSDPTAITSLLEIPLSGGRYEFQILNIRKGRWDAQEIMDKIAEEQKLFGSSVFVESNGCFVPGTRVLTPAGYKPIESVVPGDLVWTHKGRWRPVLERYDGTARHVTPARAKGVLPVRCTPNHWFWVRQAGRTPGRGGGHYRPVGDPGWCSIGFPDCEQYASLAVASWPACAPEIRLAATQKMNAKTLRIDENAALALGMFMAEGHTTDSHVYWTLNRTEGYLADLIDDGLGDLCAGTFRRRESRNTLRMVLGNKQIAAALHVGTRSNKCLPLSWMGWPLPLRIALVRGWLLGDGCIVANGNRKKLATRSISACTVSRNWALFVRTTLMQAGITVALRETHARKTSVIEGRTVNRSPMFLLNLTSDGSEALRTYMTHPAEAIRWGDSWWAHDEDRKKRQRRSGSPIVLDEMGAWSKIPKLDPDPAKTYQSYDDGPVHNLKVEEDESFTVEDFVVHNAQDLLVQLLQMSGRNIPVTAFHTGRNKFDPMFGVESIFGQMALGLWTFPSWEGTMDTVEAELEGLIQEMLAYTPGNHTGDVLMSLWIASEGARMSRATAAGKVEYGRLRLRR